MPTPRNDEALIRPQNPASEITTSNRTTCPPEEVRENSNRVYDNDDSVQSEVATVVNSSVESQIDLANEHTRSVLSTTDTQSSSHLQKKDENLLRDTPSPMSALEDNVECEQRPLLSAPSPTTSQGSTVLPAYPSGPLCSPFPTQRFRPNSTSSYLRHGSKFHGTQKSDRQVYDVQVEIKYVDMEESFLCGYLRIQGLTDDHPTLTTYFEGEIIGTKYTFQTRHAEWGSNAKVDMQHWGRFPAWLPLAKQAKKPDFSCKNFGQRENIFMRWKEYFLVPDHRVRTISGASFEGFYYICFNQVQGTVSGIYFHARSEKYQQLELTHVPDNGCMSAIEFR